MKKHRKLLSLALVITIILSLMLPVITSEAAVGDVYDYVAEMDGTQGGSSGKWFYEYLECADTDSGYKQDENGGDIFSQYPYFGLSNTAWQNAKAWSTSRNEATGLVSLYSPQGAIGANWCWSGFARRGFNQVATFIAPETGYVRITADIRAPQNTSSNGVRFKIVRYSADNKPVEQVYPETGWHLMQPWGSGANPEYHNISGVYASVSENEKLCLIFDCNGNDAGDEFTISQYTMTYIDPISFDQEEYYAAYYTDPAYTDLNFINIPVTLIDNAAGETEYFSSDESVIYPVDNYGGFAVRGTNVTYNGGTAAGYERQEPVIITARLIRDGLVIAEASAGVYISENPISPNAESYVWSHKAQNLSDFPIWSYQSSSLVTELEDIKDVQYTPMTLGFTPYGSDGLGWYRYSGSGGNYRLDMVNSGLSPSADAALTFTAPRSGLIRIEGSADDRLAGSATGNGIGIAIRLRQGDTKTQIYPSQELWQTVECSGIKDESTYFSYPAQYVTVNEGDKIYFVANARGNNDSDTYWW